MHYNEARQYLDSHSGTGIVLGLDTMKELMKRLGNPQNKVKFIHVAGTNGKGSVIAMTSQILGEAGYRVGRYCSPSVFCYEEKIQTWKTKQEGWTYIQQQEVASIMTDIKEVADAMEREGLPYPTVFELETAMAFCHFANEQCEYVLLETGMGGDLDATNIVTTTSCAVLVSIGIDHSRILGTTLGEIAGHKAGIIKQGRPTVTMEQKQEAQAVIVQRCQALNSVLSVAKIHDAQILEYDKTGQTISYGAFPVVRTPLLGVFQKDNIAVVLEIVTCLRKQGVVISDEAIINGIGHTTWPGRLEPISEKPWIVIDGAHNPDAAQKLSATVRKYFTNQKIVYIIGVLADKDYKMVMEYLCPLGSAFFTITPDNARALSANRLKETIQDVIGTADGKIVNAMDSIEEALGAAKKEAGEQGVIVACGSLSFLGQLRKLVKTLHMEENYG